MKKDFKKLTWLISMINEASTVRMDRTLDIITPVDPSARKKKKVPQEELKLAA